MDMEHQQQLVELEQRHQEKVPESITIHCLMWTQIFHLKLVCSLYLHPLYPLSQVHYFLSQLQSRPESDEAKQNAEGRLEDTELQQRLKVQVSLELTCRTLLLNFFSTWDAAALLWLFPLGGQVAGTDWGESETDGAEWAIQTGRHKKMSQHEMYSLIKILFTCIRPEGLFVWNWFIYFSSEILTASPCEFKEGPFTHHQQRKQSRRLIWLHSSEGT